MSAQLESPHFFRDGDLVAALDGTRGRVVEEWALYALIEWASGDREEVDQFDPAVSVVERAAS